MDLFCGQLQIDYNCLELVRNVLEMISPNFFRGLTPNFL